MIGFILRGMGFGGPGLLGIVGASVLACCALFGMYKCSKCRARDCSCIKRCMRATGTDTFDDFDVVIVIHEALFTAASKLSTCVRLTAGPHQVATDSSHNGVFHQPLSLFVEQGTEAITVELMDSGGNKVLANLRLDTEKDVLKCKEKAVREKVFTMKQRNKGILNPRVKLSIRMEHADAAEEGLLAGMNATAETNMMLREHLHHARISNSSASSSASPPLSELDLLVKGCAGPVEMFGSWGSREQVYLAARGPPEVRKHSLGVWDTQSHFDKGHAPREEIDLLKVQSVQPDPGRSEVFLISYVQADKVKSRLTLRRVDRGRDVWVEMLTLLIKLLRDQREKKKLLR